MPLATTLPPSHNMTLECVDITHQFGETTVLSDVSLSVAPGEVLSIIGPSGTGKTTLLRILALYQEPTSGIVRINGNSVWDKTKRERLSARRNIAMVFQEANLFDTSVQRNVSYGLRVRQDWIDRCRAFLPGITTPEEDRVLELLDLVGLSDEYNRSASSLSGGEAQRVAFARAMAYEPEVIFLDEPTSDLDPRNTAFVEEAVETAKLQGLSVVLATHNMNQAERLADRVAILINGKITEIGSTKDIFTSPTSTKTRKFIDGELVY